MRRRVRLALAVAAVGGWALLGSAGLPWIAARGGRGVAGDEARWSQGWGARAGAMVASAVWRAGEPEGEREKGGAAPEEGGGRAVPPRRWLGVVGGMEAFGEDAWRDVLAAPREDKLARAVDERYWKLAGEMYVHWRVRDERPGGAAEEAALLAPFYHALAYLKHRRGGDQSRRPELLLEGAASAAKEGAGGNASRVAWVWTMDHGPCGGLAEKRRARVLPPDVVAGRSVSVSPGRPTEPCRLPAGTAVLPPTVRPGAVRFALASALAAAGRGPAPDPAWLSAGAASLWGWTAPAAAPTRAEYGLWLGSAPRPRTLMWHGQPASEGGVRKRVLAAAGVRAGGRRLGAAEYAKEMLGSRFCLALPGFAWWSPRVVEAILFGCVPVILRGGPLPAAGEPWEERAVLFGEGEARGLVERLAGMPDDTVRGLRERGLDALPRLLLLPQRLPGWWGERDAFDDAVASLLGKV